MPLASISALWSPKPVRSGADSLLQLDDLGCGHGSFPAKLVDGDSRKCRCRFDAPGCGLANRYLGDCPVKVGRLRGRGYAARQCERDDCECGFHVSPF